MIIIVSIIIIIIIDVTIIIIITIMRKVITLMITNCNYNYDHNHFQMDKYNQLSSLLGKWFLSIKFEVSCTKVASFFEDRRIWNFITPMQNWHNFFDFLFVSEHLQQVHYFPQRVKAWVSPYLFRNIICLNRSSKIQPVVENFQNNISFVLKRSKSLTSPKYCSGQIWSISHISTNYTRKKIQ